MCLTIDEKEKNVPYNETNIRYKVVLVEKNGTHRAPFQMSQYNKEGWNQCQMGNVNFRPRDHGFHVFVNRQGAVGEKGNHSGAVVKKIEVRGFLQRGTWKNKKSETWAMFRFID